MSEQRTANAELMSGSSMLFTRKCDPYKNGVANVEYQCTPGQLFVTTLVPYNAAFVASKDYNTLLFRQPLIPTNRIKK